MVFEEFGEDVLGILRSLSMLGEGIWGSCFDIDESMNGLITVIETTI